MTRDEVLRYLDLPSPSMREALDLITRVASTQTNVFINGPSGSGKEFVARAVHAFSTRASGPFIAVNCGAIPRELLEMSPVTIQVTLRWLFFSCQKRFCKSAIPV